MKRIVAISLSILLISSCNSTEMEPTKTTDEGSNQPGVENVNGNIPETQNSISLDTKDSSVKRDSVN